MSELVPTSPGALARWTAVLVPAAQLAERIAGTEFVPYAMRNKPDVVTAAIMYGDEIGVGPMQALASIHVVEGRPQPSAELMRALILRAGHTLTVHVLSGEVCRMSGLRAGSPESDRVPVEWTMAMARAAGLANKKNWREYPRAMLLARATGDLARLLFPDVVKGLGYFGDDVETVESLDAWARSVPDDTPAQPERKRVTRKRALPSPGHHPPATDDHPAPDGSVDVPLPEVVPDGEPEVATDPWSELGGQPTEPERPPVAPYVESGTESRPDDVPLPPGPGDRPRTDPERPIGPGLHRGLMAAFSAIAPEHDHDLRVGLSSAILTRDVDSTKHLTAREALTMTRILNDIQTGAVVWSQRDDGTYTVQRVRDE
jgi:hypothetical protein